MKPLAGGCFVLRSATMGLQISRATMTEIPTVKILADTPLGYAIINESDYDRTKHTLWREHPEEESGDTADAVTPESEPESTEEVEQKPRKRRNPVEGDV